VTLGPVERAALLGVARGAVRARLGLSAGPELPGDGPLSEPAGAFVTLRVNGELRGCIGTFTPQGSLASTVARMAAAAATEDPRFPPLGAEELDDLDVHVSVLEPRRRMQDPSEIAIGRDGIAVQLGWQRGALLPQVAVEEGWDARTFLARTCLKAGLPPDAWRDPQATVELFAAEEIRPERLDPARPGV
jgi:AmmeMemoRadiSam system protein A